MAKQGYPASGARYGGHPGAAGYPATGSRYGAHPDAGGSPLPTDVDFAAAGADFWLDASRPASYTATGTTLTSLASLISGTPLTTIVGAPQIITDPRDDRPSFNFPRNAADYVTGVDAQYIASATGTDRTFCAISVIEPGDVTFAAAIDSVRNTGNISGQEFLSSNGLWYYERDGAPSGPARVATSSGVQAGCQVLLQYSEDGLTVKTSINGGAETTAAAMLTAGAIAPNVVGIGIQTGSTNTVPYYGMIKELARFGSPRTAPERASWVATLMRKHRATTAPQVYMLGDSITAAVTVGVTNGGMGALLAQRMRALGYYCDPQGPFAQALAYPYRHSGVSGNTCAQMNTRVTSTTQGLGKGGASKSYYQRVRLCCLFAGTNDVVTDPTAANYATLLNNVYAQMLQAQPDFRISVTPVTDINGSTAAVNTYNAAKAAIHAAFEAAHPGVLIYWDAFQACPWNGTNYIDSTHQSDAGYAALVDHPTFGLLQAVLPYLVSLQVT
jgi:lysophospholipase L1-like esterase